MRKNYIIAVTALAVCAYITLSSFKTTGAHPSSTGAPGEQTCAQTGCHTTASVTNDNTNMVNTLLFSSADSSYTPGKTYTVTVKAKKAGIVKFGFEICSLINSNTANAGAWTITDANRTQLESGSGALATREYITHTTNGTPATASGLDQWSFNWTAPATNVGKITFYYITNCTNNNGANTGDQLFLSSFQVHPSSPNSVSEWMKEEDFQALLNSSSRELILNYSLLKECRLAVKVFDAQGKTIKEMNSSEKPAGDYSDHISLTQDIRAGIYFVHLDINNQTLTKKIIIQ